ncbi:MAG: SMP-30/gluconolactonase/LRE family protein [Planctomycetes bacterium]|nr:SMP-30/gluconolactonase/LRE family protein [Planctomycetota bacterium]
MLVALALAGAVRASADDRAPARPDAIVDLRTNEGVKLVKGQWRVHDVAIADVDHHAPGADLKPTGPANRTHDVAPKAGAADFDDSSWEAVDASSLEVRRGGGRLSFEWYRIAVTLPDRIGALDVAGASAFFEIVVDDYAEVWVDGRLPQVLGATGGPVVKGWNAPNRVLLTHDATPGQKFQLAVFGANAPLSDPPANYVWIRSATLDVYRPGRLAVGQEVPLEVTRLDPAIDAIVPKNAKLEKLADGFEFLEGPLWVPEGYLLFSDPNRNVIYRWSADAGVTIFRTKSGYTGIDVGEYHQPGSNGLALDHDGRLTIDEHGNRRVTRLEKNGTLTVLADRYEGKRLNSPNDLVYRSDGSLWFTDPPFGLPNVFEDPKKELPYSGVFRLADGKLHLVSTDLVGPNGLAFSPDEKFLYVDDWDPKKKVVMRYEIADDGALQAGTVFFDMGGAPGEEALDGLKVDVQGNLYVSGPGGVWILSAEGKHLGTIKGPELPANFAWGDVDGKTLYLCARTSLYRVRLGVAGTRAFPAKGRD